MDSRFFWVVWFALMLFYGLGMFVGYLLWGAS